jgi:hypothetical protein
MGTWERLAEERRPLPDVIEAMVRDFDYVTFVEVQRKLEDFYPMRGDLMYGFAPINCWFWAGMSPEFCDAVDALLAEGRLHPVPSQPLTYFIDGGALNLPLALRVPAKGYKSERWMPVCLRLGAGPEGKVK